MPAATDNFENKLIDWMLRGQALGLNGASAGAGSGPTQVFISLKSAPDSDGAQGAELSGGGYARVAVPCTLAAWAGTQGAGTTAASSGSSGQASNNNAVTFPTPSGAWGQAVGFGVHDQAVGGIELFYGALAAPKTINNGDPAPSFAAGALVIQLDN